MGRTATECTGSGVIDAESFRPLRGIWADMIVSIGGDPSKVTITVGNVIIRVVPDEVVPSESLVLCRDIGKDNSNAGVCVVSLVVSSIHQEN
jgi:hypothetical protein